MKDKELNGIKTALSDKIGAFSPDYSSHSVGRISFSGDGVITVRGLQGAKYGELLDVDGRYRAIVLDLREDEVGAIVLGDEDSVSANMLVRCTGRIVEVPVGKELIGRVIDPLGNPIDGRGAINCSGFRPIEAAAPPIIARAKVNQPLCTGILSVDSMMPIGKGQRQLIIGDRQTGKTSIAIDAVLNQKGKDVYCVYVAIGQKTSAVASLVHTLDEYGALDYTVVVCSTARDSAPMQYIAPFAGCAVAEEFMYSGKDVLVVYDDLSKHAVAYRAMSLLLKRPSGRDAYPGDVFYLHSRLLERAAKLKKEYGGGSMTALPVVETQAGDISAYVPTNVISITDGQIYLESDLFNSGIRPAINVGLSVSRIGGSAQVKGISKICGKLRLQLSQYRELSVFAQFGSEIDAETKAMLESGSKLTEALKQNVNCPYSVAHEILVLFLAMKDLLKSVPVKHVRDFISSFITYLEANRSEIAERIEKTQELSMEDAMSIEEAAREFFRYYFEEETI